MMSLRTRLFIIISLVVLLILGVSIFLVVRFGKKATTPVENSQNTLTTSDPSNSSTNYPDTQVVNTPIATPPTNFSPEEIEKNTAKQLAKVFIERYGTYSTDNGSENIKEVKSLVVPEFWQTLSARIQEGVVNENQAPSGNFSSMSTQVFNLVLKDWLSNSAVVAMQLVRTEEKDGVRTVKHQNVEINMVKQNGQWLVQNFKWL